TLPRRFVVMALPPSREVVALAIGGSRVGASILFSAVAQPPASASVEGRPFVEKSGEGREAFGWRRGGPEASPQRGEIPGLQCREGREGRRTGVAEEAVPRQICRRGPLRRGSSR